MRCPHCQGGWGKSLSLFPCPGNLLSCKLRCYRGSGFPFHPHLLYNGSSEFIDQEFIKNAVNRNLRGKWFRKKKKQKGKRKDELEGKELRKSKSADRREVEKVGQGLWCLKPRATQELQGGAGVIMGLMGKGGN